VGERATARPGFEGYGGRIIAPPPRCSGREREPVGRLDPDHGRDDDLFERAVSRAEQLLHGLGFIDDVAQRLSNRVQITTDGLKAYVDAIDTAFGGEVDYAVLIKLFGEPVGGKSERRYSPAECTGIRKEAIQGDPDMKHVSTSYAERNNLNVRMHTRRMTRLTNAFSKKMENHAHAMALHFLYYNFVRIHKTLKTTPAMAAGVTDRLWEVADMVEVLEAWETSDAERL
jgi:hypothetical protein